MRAGSLRRYNLIGYLVVGISTRSQVNPTAATGTERSEAYEQKRQDPEVTGTQ